MTYFGNLGNSARLGDYVKTEGVTGEYTPLQIGQVGLMTRDLVLYVCASSAADTPRRSLALTPPLLRRQGRACTPVAPAEERRTAKAIPAASEEKQPRDPAETSYGNLKGGVASTVEDELTKSNIAEDRIYVRDYVYMMKHWMNLMMMLGPVIGRVECARGTRTSVTELRLQNKTFWYRAGETTAPRESMTVRWDFITRLTSDATVSKHVVAAAVTPHSIAVVTYTGTRPNNSMPASTLPSPTPVSSRLVENRA